MCSVLFQAAKPPHCFSCTDQSLLQRAGVPEAREPPERGITVKYGPAHRADVRQPEKDNLKIGCYGLNVHVKIWQTTVMGLRSWKLNLIMGLRGEAFGKRWELTSLGWGPHDWLLMGIYETETLQTQHSASALRCDTGSLQDSHHIGAHWPLDLQTVT